MTRAGKSENQGREDLLIGSPADNNQQGEVLS